MNDPHFHLTAEIQQQICAYIRFGGFPESSAEAVGIPAEVFHRWLRYGQSKRANPLYRDFLLAVRTAQTQARVKTEHEAREKRPLDWLKNGPGKETARLPGWTSPVKPATPSKRKSGLSAERAQELITILLQALTPFPEARVAAAEALSKGGWITDDPDGQPEEATRDLLPTAMETERQPRDNPAPPAEAMPVMAEPCPASAAPPAPDPGFTPPNVKEPIGPSALPAMETKCFDVAPARLPACCPQVSVKASPTRSEAVVNPSRSDNGMTTKASASGGPRQEKPTKTGPGPWDSLDAGHWIVFSSS